jgi:hypothetical protein
MRKEHKKSNVGLRDFFDHFKSLSSADLQQGTEHTWSDPGSVSESDIMFDELELPVFIDEIEAAVRSLKRDKSNADDGILNEYLIE